MLVVWPNFVGAALTLLFATAGGSQACSLRQGFDDVIHIAAGHRWEEWQTETAAVIGIHPRQLQLSIAKSVIRLAMHRHLMDLAAHARVAQVLHDLRT